MKNVNITLTTPPTHLSRFLFIMSKHNTETLITINTPSVRENLAWLSSVSLFFLTTWEGTSIKNLPRNSWCEFLQCRNMGSWVSSARSNCFSKYLRVRKRQSGMEVSPHVHSAGKLSVKRETVRGRE